MPLLDLSHPLTMKTPVYPGDPAVRLTPWETALPWRVTELVLGSHSGTHMDAPRHCLPDGATIDAYGPDRWVGSGVVLPVPNPESDEAVGPGILAGLPAELPVGWFAIIATGWDRFWGASEYFYHPFLAPDLAESLRGAGCGLVAVDVPSVDSSVSGGDAVHRILADADILIVENLRGLERLPVGAALEFCFAPLPLAGTDGAPVRAFARF
ncbi:MAG: cyclase family protein [Thermomicrobiales bacterium]|nr:cyclase family protein [Thermomicrobiales bacterium]